MFERAFEVLRGFGQARLVSEITQLRSQLGLQRGWPPGHFYSPVPALEELENDEERLFGPPSRGLLGVDLNEEGQRRLFAEMTLHYAAQPFGPKKQPDLRYFFENPNFGRGEAIILYCMMNLLKPRRMVEIGSGYSSCAILDINDRCLGGSLDLVLIEPYPDLLYSLMKPGDAERVQLFASRLQDIPDKIFEDLNQNDILFIDSSHVSKAGSDVNHLFFEVLPRLSSGVYVHIHDIYYPFEYPKKWIYEGRYWNEAYMLRAFLQNNVSFEISFFNSWWGMFEHNLLARDMPLLADHQGSSLWLRKR